MNCLHFVEYVLFSLGKISSWIDLDSEDETLRQDSEITLKQEIAWASHLSLQVNHDMFDLVMWYMKMITILTKDHDDILFSPA